MSEWISVNDRVPELTKYHPNSKTQKRLYPSINVLVKCLNDSEITIGYLTQWGWTLFGDGCFSCEKENSIVTHWMRLPVPPKDSQDAINKSIEEGLIRDPNEI